MVGVYSSGPQMRLRRISVKATIYLVLSSVDKERAISWASSQSFNGFSEMKGVGDSIFGAAIDIGNV